MADDPDDMGDLLDIVICMLAIFSFVGSIGNALVLYIFYNLKNKLTSTIFILALAGFDFTTCIITMPFTIVVEYYTFKVPGGFCQLYHFFMSAPVCFSAICMVGIALDRYLCICHPFKHAMTTQRAQFTVLFMVALAMTIGVITCLFHGVRIPPPTPDSAVNSTINLTDIFLNDTDFDQMTTLPLVGYEYGFSTLDNYTSTTSPENVTRNETQMDAMCMESFDIFSKGFFKVFQKIYSSIFLVSCIVVAVLYALIYRSVINQRNKKLKMTSADDNCCVFFPSSLSSDGGFENTEISTMIADEQTEQTTMEHKELMVNNSSVPNSTSQKKQKQNKSDKRCKNKAMRQGSISKKARVEKMRMANIRTAIMLSVVTLVFIIAFLPAWLMALGLIDLNLIVFYMYFLYNVANPFIYAFMNQTFRNQLVALFRCRA